MNELKELFLTPLLAERNFVAIWIISLAIMIGLYEILSLWQKKDKDLTSTPNNISAILFNKSKHNIDNQSRVAWIIFGVFVIFYIYLMFKDEDFAYWDNTIFTHFSLIGKPNYMPIWRDSGRFFPLGHLEYNLLAIIGKNVFVYQGFSGVQLLFLIYLLNSLLLKLPSWYRLMTISILMVNQSFIYSFFGMIYPERNVIFWLIVLIFCCHQLSDRKSIRLYTYIGLIAIQFCLYYKEPVFILIGSFFLSRLLLNYFWFNSNAKLSQFIWGNYLNFSGLILCVVYFVCYKLIVDSNITDKYNYNSQDSLIKTLSLYFNESIILTFFCILLLIRVTELSLSKNKVNIIWDPLALSGLLYLLAFVKLEMYTPYYAAPFYLIATLYLSQFIYKYLIKPRSSSSVLKRIFFWAIAFFLGVVILTQCLHQSSQHILFRKNLIAGHVKLATFIKDYVNQQDKEQLNIFFPEQVSEYHIAVFNAYLEYSGANLYYKNKNPLIDTISENIIKESQTFTSIKLLSPRQFKDNLCVSWFTINCFTVPSADKDDLIVILPDVYTNELIDTLKSDGEIIYSYHHQSNYSIVEKILMLFSQKDFSFMDVYIIKK